MVEEDLLSEYGSDATSIYIGPLPDVTPSLVVRPGWILQKPVRGTMFRLRRSASGIGEVSVLVERYDAAKAGGLGRSLSANSRRRNPVERISADAAPLGR